jgi:hypothetical protein
MERMQPTYRGEEDALAMSTASGLDHEQLSYLIHDMRSVTTSVALMVDLLELPTVREIAFSIFGELLPESESFASESWNEGCHVQFVPAHRSGYSGSYLRNCCIWNILGDWRMLRN